MSSLLGIYFILFFICVYLLLWKKRPLRWVLLVSAIIMFSLATADIIYTYHLVFNRLLPRRLTFTELFPKYMLFVTNKYVVIFTKSDTSLTNFILGSALADSLLVRI